MLGLVRIRRPLCLSFHCNRRHKADEKALPFLRRSLRLEELESRTLLAYAPAQILHAYGFDQLPYDGSGQTIAVVDAYDNPSLTYDLQNFDQLFNLPDPTLTIAQPQGQPGYDAGWGLETDLDVEWAHAVAPGANILLVEARNDSGNDLLGAVNYARQQPGVVAVSISWEGSEFPAETAYDSYFTTPAGHIGGSGLPGGVTFVAASGDQGAGVVWPASSPNVLSIGGTTLTLDDNNDIVSETGWSGSGGGVSRYEPEPDSQLPFQATGMRTTPDFAYNADLATPYWTYASNYGGLQAVFGTSAGAPQWAGLIALADQALAMDGIGSLDGATQTIPDLYTLASQSYSTYYNDIVSGNNGYQAGPGYDLVTGIGTPIANQVVPGLVNLTEQPGGGAAALGSNGTSPLVRGEGPSLPSPPGPSSRLAPAPLATHPEPFAPSSPVEQNIASNQAVFFVSNVPDNAASGPGQENVALLFSTSRIAYAGREARLVAAYVQPAAHPVGFADRGVKGGGGDNPVLTQDSDGDGAADTITPSALESSRGSAFPPSYLSAAAANREPNRDAWFLVGEPPIGAGQPEATLQSAFDSLIPLPDPVAAVGTVAIALGGYWSRPFRPVVTSAPLPPGARRNGSENRSLRLC
jgi:hypothetical protein